MRFRIKITLSNISGGATVPTAWVDYDPNQITMQVINDNGHPRREINGTIEITEDSYDDLISYVNDEPLKFGKIVKVDIYNNNTLIGSTDNAELTFNNIQEKRASFKVGGYIDDEYGNIYKYWDVIYNIAPTTTQTVRNFDFRGYESIGSSASIRIGATQEEYEQFVIDECSNREGYTASQIQFSSGGTVTLMSLSLRRLVAYGYYAGSERYPPAGVDWNYDSDVTLSGTLYPKYVKKPNTFSITTWQTFAGASTPDQFINVEGFNNFIGYIDYTNVARQVDDVIEYLMSQIDPAILFDASSFGGLSGTAYEYMMMLGISDFILADGGLQKSNPQTVLNISLGRLLSWLEKRGFYWYLEESGGNYYFRLDLKYNQSLNAPSDDLQNYYNRNWVRDIKDYNIADIPFWYVKNDSISKTPSFVFSYSFFIAGTEEDPFYNLSDEYLFTDINDVQDAKTSKYDDSVENFVLLACESAAGTIQTRQDTSIYHPRTVVNFAMSIPYICENVLSNLPTIYKAGGGVFYSQDRLAKLKQAKIRVPLNNIFEDLDMFAYIKNSQGEEMEIERITQKLSENIAEIDFKL
jgi:hypothetical protein